MKQILFLLIISICWGCTANTDTEKHHGKRDRVVNVRDKIKELALDDVLISPFSSVFIIHNYLMINDSRTSAEQLHLFDKNSFRHLTSTAYRGQGVGEITTIGYIASDFKNNLFYVTDHGKQKIFTYDCDSVLSNPLYNPTEKIAIQAHFSPYNYHYINDSIALGVIFQPIPAAPFKHITAKINMNTSEIIPTSYTHPDIEVKRIGFAVSNELGLYVECYHYHDLMTICDFDGNLKCNIYGRQWDNQKTNQYSYYGDVVFCGDKIIASFAGGKERYDETEDNLPSAFLVFNTEGDYIQTLETNYRIQNFCYDKDNNRLILNMDDEIQFAYLELNGIIE